VFLADEDDCASYYVCFNGDMIHRTCHLPLLWDHRNSWCDFPQNVICPSLCPGLDDPDNPVYIPHETNCSYYYLCFNGTRLLRRCSDGLIWDRDLEWCNFANETVCPVQEFAEYEVEDSIEIFHSDNEDEGVWDARCPSYNDPNFTVHLPHEEFCDRFYKCSYGRIFVILCPPGLHFSVQHDRCEWPALANCDPTQLPPLQTTTASPTTLPPPGSGQCPMIDDPWV
jgi:Chitin binding Peritrophin-A domain